jgi:hypothetical protein
MHIFWWLAAGLQSNIKLPLEISSVYLLFDNTKYLIIWHLSSAFGARVKEFYCTARHSS